MNCKHAKTQNLVEIIREGIARRGFYMLLDERVKLICGEDCDCEQLEQHRGRIALFASELGWAAEVDRQNVTFRAANR